MKKYIILIFILLVAILPSNSAKLMDLSSHTKLTAEDYSSRQIWTENNKKFVQVWLKTENYDNLFFGGNFYYRYDKTQYLFNCTDKKFKITNMDYYSFHDRKINTTNSFDKNSWYDVPDNTRYAKIMNLACGY